jgi:hypothetical protein
MKTKSIITIAIALIAATFLTAQNKADPDYMILDETRRDALTYNVKEAIKKGWTPQGNVTVVYRQDSATRYLFFQAMVK